jgi:CRISPR-associated endoribonuclease Cas6
MSKLLSMVVHVSPTERTHIKGHMGKAIQQMMKSTILGTELATELDTRGDIQPYTVSSLFYSGSERPLKGDVAPFDVAWFRVTGIGSTAFGDRVVEVIERWRADPPQQIEIDRLAWGVRSTCTQPNEHPWANAITFADLQNRYRQRTHVERLSFHFLSPTTFHSESLHVPLPIPALLYRKLIDGWGKLTPIELDEHLALFAQQFLQIERCSLDTHSVLLKNEPFVGFIGEVQYSLQRFNDGLKKRQPDVYAAIEMKRDILGQWLALLAEFAFYCGVGAKCASGMGMVRAEAH